MLYFDRIPLYGVFIICIGLSLIGSILVKLLQVPILRKKFPPKNMSDEKSPPVVVLGEDSKKEEKKNEISEISSEGLVLINRR